MIPSEEDLIRQKTPPPVSLSLPAVASNLMVVRQVVTGAAHVAGLDDALIDDIKVAVTEACTNVVVHAYDDHGGAMEVGIWAQPNEMTVSVVDHGRGIVENNGDTRIDRGGLGLGMGLIAVLARTVEVTNRPDGGTLVMMRFGSDPDSAGPPYADAATSPA